ncbi:hypothetical protein ATCV1_z272L [Acanthocystis turfacea chlorella virus 1]|uniref:Uncharacterized protein z272L n=1 Tax=Chlorovirus heliozoae TaxID=322019 RepID=A7K8N2_9PHYC|nr:hypothetical protein ATCV1_z272L [Acanthocystis turfacea chlorella virus 1]ABT16406.1 hypothetical protein ATCV1_z272L [Acanthocystis turfacea chlorella virus 1]
MFFYQSYFHIGRFCLVPALVNIIYEYICGTMLSYRTFYCHTFPLLLSRVLYVYRKTLFRGERRVS